MSFTTQSRKAFVTGGTGFVGSNLVAALIEDRWAVVALHRPGSNVSDLKRLGVTLASGDITDAASLDRAIPEAVDAVFSVAGDMSTWSRNNARQTAMNVGGTRNLVQAALHKRARCFVHTSTAPAYGIDDAPLSEETVATAAGSWINYVRTKWLAEEEVRAGVTRGLHAVIINPCAILGPRDTTGWASLFAQIKAGRLKALPPGVATWNHVRSVAWAHIAAVDKGRRGENYILSGETQPLAVALRMMAEQLGGELTARVVPPFLFKTMGRLAGLVGAITGKQPALTPEMATLMCWQNRCATHKAETELGYEVVPLRRCIADSHAWLVEHGRL